LTSVSLTPLNPSIALAQGATQAFDAVGSYSFGNPQDITSQLTWTSMDTTVATISSKGVATAVGSGRVVVTGTIQDPQSQKIFQVSTILTVIPQLTGITVSPATAQIAKGTTQQFTATGKYNDGTTPDITALVSWCVGDPWIRNLPVTDAVPMYFRMGPERDLRRDPSTVSLCQSSIGLSTDELFRVSLPQRVFLFHPRPWTREALRTAISEVNRWR